MTFGEKLKLARKNKKLSQEELAKMIDVSRVAITNYELDRNTPTYANIQKLSKILEIDFTNERPVKKIPIKGTASCGIVDGNHLQDTGEYSYYNGDFYTPALYCIIANGDSMAPEIEDGDEVICDPDVEVQNGDIVHYRIGNESALKVYYKDEDAYIIQFIPYNPTEEFKTKTIRLDDDAANEVKISKVVAINKLKFNNRRSRLRLIGKA